jgi:hypothetical protein
MSARRYEPVGRSIAGAEERVGSVEGSEQVLLLSAEAIEVVVDVDPKASLKRWNLLPQKGYKQSATAEPVAAIVADLKLRARWLDLANSERLSSAHMTCWTRSLLR